VSAAPAAAPAVPYTVRCEAGRLIEARLLSLRDVADVVSFEEAMGRGFAKSGGQAIICADWRRAHLFAPEVADRLIGLLQRANPRVVRAAILLTQDQAVFALQVERVVRAAGHRVRRAFRSKNQMRQFLALDLDDAELRALDEFLRAPATSLEPGASSRVRRSSAPPAPA
jgi:hypothetical protein